MAKIEHELTLKDTASRVYNQFVGNINRQAATLDNTFKSVGAAIGAAFSIAAIGNFTQKAAAANAEVAKLDQSLANTGLTQYRNELLETSKALRNKTAVDDDEIVKLQSLLVGYTGNIDAVRKLTPAILDLAAGTGMSVEAAAKLVAKSNEGSEGLKRLGITIGETHSEEERLARITEEVNKRYKGMAETFANTDAGKLQTLSIAMEDLQESAGNLFLSILRPVLPGIIKSFDVLSWLIEKIFGALKIGVTVIMTGLVMPLARVEEGLNALGITSSHVFQNLMISGIKQTIDESNKLVGNTESAERSVAKLGNTTYSTAVQQQTLADRIKKLKNEIEQLNIGSAERIQKLVQLQELERQQEILLNQESLEVQRLTRNWDSFTKTMQIAGVMATKTGKDYKKAANDIKVSSVEVEEATTTAFDNIMTKFQSSQQVTVELTNIVFGNLQQAIQSTFSGEAGVIKQFFKSALNAVINFVEGYLAAAAAKAIAEQVFTFGTTLAGELAFIASATAALEVARGAINRFHEGGIVGQFGERIPLSSDERPAILRVGETVLPTRPGERVTGTTIFSPTININAPGTPKEMVISALKQVAREIGVESVGEIKINQRNRLVIA